MPDVELECGVNRCDLDQAQSVRRVFFLDEPSGLACRLVLWDQEQCWGYVGVPPGHLFFGLEVDDCPVDCRPPGSACEHSPSRELEVPGGVQQAGHSVGLWWFGFPCPGDWREASQAIRGLAAQLDCWSAPELAGTEANDR